MRVLTNYSWVILLCDHLNLVKSGFLVLSFTVVKDRVESQVDRLLMTLDIFVNVSLLAIVADHRL